MSNSVIPTDATARPATARLAAATRENVALIGQPMSGTTGVALETLELAAENGRDALLISTARGAGRLDVPDDVACIDCTPGPTAGADASINSPSDMTGISMPLSRFLDDADSPVVVLDSLSSLLPYVDEREAFRFLSILSNQVESAGGLAVVTVNDGAHDERTVRTFAQLFDGQVKLRETPGGVEARGKGTPTMPAEWLTARR
jgi:hypothetical protein